MLPQVVLALFATAMAAATAVTTAPTAVVRNGTVAGKYLAGFDQDAFLGIPFAQPPVGDLRFRHPVPINTSWSTPLEATDYSDTCPDSPTGFSDGFVMSEDCLGLNVVRPAGTSEKDSLPVLVWIYGGGLITGSSADPRYNLSYIVQQSTNMGKPIVAVSLNYRVAGLGFLASKEVLDAGVANLGLFDQRLALHWVHENVAAFGGDPSKVTIWGESAGAYSVGYHMVAFDGQDEGLFRAAILESGSALGYAIYDPTEVETTSQPIYDTVAKAVGCFDAADSLQCLREAPFEQLNASLYSLTYGPVLDGVFFKRRPSESFAQGLLVDAALLVGSNTDEGTAPFWGPRGTLNTTEDVRKFASLLPSGASPLPANVSFVFDSHTHLSAAALDTLLQLYPDDPAAGCPFNTGEERFADQGFMYKRGAAIGGDWAIQAGRRQTAQHYSTLGKPVYSYRFDQSPWNNEEEGITLIQPVYATHFAEICFTFNNPDKNVNWIGPYQSFQDLSNFMSRSWVSFIHDLDPNGHGVENVPTWPDYSVGQENIVFLVNGSYVEKDDWRVPQLQFWSQSWSSLSV